MWKKTAVKLTHLALTEMWGKASPHAIDYGADPGLLSVVKEGTCIACLQKQNKNNGNVCKAYMVHMAWHGKAYMAWHGMAWHGKVYMASSWLLDKASRLQSQSYMTGFNFFYYD